MRSAVAPDLAFGPTAFVAIERVRRSVFRPMLRGAVAATGIQHVDYPRGTATFGWLGATMEACPLAIDLARNFRVRPCASFTFGALRASATPATDARYETRKWLGAGALGRFEWEVLPRTMRLELGGGLVVPFQRDRFFVAPDTTLFVVPSAGMTADVGVAFLLFS